MQKPRMRALVLAFATALCGVEVAQGYSAQPLRAQRVRGGGGVDSQGGLSLVETSSNSTNEMSIATLEKNINHENVDQTPFMRYAVTPKPFVDHANINPKRCPTGDSLVGCFIDTQTEHQRYYNEHVPREDRELMTPEVCYRFCLNASGVQFFGLRRGDECYCTPFFHDTGKLGRGECDMPCVGDQSQMCGGEEKANIYEMHDCNNLPALRCRNPPPAVEHAKHYGSNYYRKTGTPCANSKQGALTNENSHCEIECETGYELTENTIECVEKGDRLSYSWATIEGKAVCSPVPCGLPPTVEAANHIPVPKFFPENTTYTCLTGYTTNELHDGPKDFDTTCQADQQFSTPVGCHKVICYKCPSHKYTHNATQTDDRYFQDDCDYRCQRGFTLDTTPLGPSTFTTSCKADGNFSKPKECKHVSCGPRQTIGHADIVKTGEGEGRKKVMVYMETVDYKCHEGYSLTGQFGGETEQTRECLYTGEYSSFETCKPVACGYPASVEDSTFDPSPRWFPEMTTYTCDYGYTLTGKPGGNIMATIQCGPEGRFLEDTPQCLPVECGPPPTVEKADLNHPGLGPVMVNYASDAIMYTCDAGYSAIDEDDVWTPNKNQFSLTCRADGSFSPPLNCVNINDCMVQTCGAFGTCVDHPNPEGVHFDDYDCDCKPGYEQTLTQSLVHASEMEKVCTNINDCPRENVCGGENVHSINRGACQDKLIDYDCLCSSGYEVTKLPALPDNDTCTPVICGPAPNVGFATSDKDGVVVDYDTPPWTYLCDEGYTIDGLPLGAKTTVKSCTSGATFSAGPDTCLPVTCGSTRSARHADMSPPLMELHYDEELTYTCEIGYTLDAQVGGVDHWKVNCLANGTQTPMSICLPVECGIPEPTTGAREFATYVPAKAGTLVFKEVARIVCDYGYSLDQSTTPSMGEYEVSCLSNGTFGYLRKCKPVLCGVPPDVMFSSKSVHSAMVYPEDVEYTCDFGYSLTGNVTGEMKHDVDCQGNATFSPTKPCMPVTCGRSPRLENATYPGTSHVYLERALYRCLEGFSTDGKADGPKSFALNCAGTGEYVGLDGCKPIECGTVEKRTFAHQIPVGAEALSTLVFGQVAMFECEPGYNRDGRYLSTHVFATVRCQADGTMTNPSPCVNLDDCESPENKCSHKQSGPDGLTHGAGHCVDNAKPTGEHMEDFSCACDSGFAENVTAHERYCYNIPDCPLDPVVACLPGTCHDLINNYYCHCPTGYYEGRNPTDNLAHDCLPVYCGAPPTVEFAKTPTESDQYFDMPPLNYTCDTGYTLDGTATGVATFSLKCHANRSFTRPPTCLPVACGDAPHVNNASYPAGPKVFPEEVPYQCNTGFSIDATYDGVTNKKFSSECKADGSFSPVKPCLNIKCPALSKQKHTINDDSGTILAYPALLAKTCMAGYALDANQHNAIQYNVYCNAEGVLVGGGRPDTAVADWRQCTPINCGAFPTVAQASVSGSKFFTEFATVQCNTGYSVDQTVAPSSAFYTIRCQTSGGYNAHPDCLPVSCGSASYVTKTTRSDEGEKFYTETVTYSIDTGYTLNAEANGPKQFTINCQADGNFTPTQMPHPVRCGSAPVKENSAHPGGSHTYLQEESYRCSAGYSMDSRAWIDGGANSFNLTCKEDGDYHWIDGDVDKPHSDAYCQKVSCGVPAVPDFSSPGRTAVNENKFRDRADFTCRPGYSLNGTLAGLTGYKVMCRANGTFEPHNGCINMDDCEGNACVPHGRCIDFENPTGNHLQDYTCECDSGYELSHDEETGEHFCGNIPDCPENACLPGSCQDLVNDYKCHCPAGYYEGENVAMEWAHDCLPVSCGTPPTVEHATTDQTAREVFYASEDVPYVCDEGYTLDAAPAGSKDFTITCQTDATFSTPAVCLPVECGLAPAVASSTVDDASKTWVYQEEPKYTCAEGFSVGGNAGDPTEFKATCTSAGTFTGVEACEANGCPLPSGSDPFGPHATFDAAAVPTVYPNNVQLTCLPGYALSEPEGTEFLQIPPKSPHHSSAAAAAAAKAKLSRKSLHPKLQKVVAKLTGRRLNKMKVTKTQVSKRQRMIQSHKVIGRRNHRNHMLDKQLVNRSAARGVNAHLHISDVTVAHNNLAGVGPDSGAQELRYENVGNVDGQQIDLIVTASNNYERKGSASSGLNSAFGKIHVKTCILVDFTFMFVDHATSQPVTLNAFDITWFDLDKGAETNKIEEIVMYDYDRMYTHVAPWYSVRQTSDGGEELIADHVNVDNPHDPMTLTENQMQASVAFRFVNVHTFHARMGSVCSNNANSGRNFNFAFESAMVPERDTTYVVSCKADGSYEIPEDLCEPIDCGQAPTVEHATVTGGTKYGETLVVTAAEGYSLDCSSSPAAKTYNITCQDTGDFTPTYNFQPICCGTAPNVEFEAKDSSSEKIFEDVVHYSLNRGYTVDGQADGEAAYDITCQSDGMFSIVSPAVPVECGAPPELENAATPASTYVFGGVATYNCAGGHSVDGTASGAKTFDVPCGADGTFGSPTGCSPIVCGAVTFPEHVDQLPDGQGELLTSLHFGQVAVFRCHKGFSKDGILSSTDVEYSVSCQVSGQNLYPATCQNMDDCDARDQNCGPNGHCQDHESPTGEHWEDFSCVCDSGYSAEVVASAKTCINVDDCPPDGCAPGSCTDLVNAYECSCPLGYRVGDGPSCTPVSCGVPPAEANAAFTPASGSRTELFYTGAPVGYTCAEGYTLDASPVGEKSFNVSCLPTGSLEAAEPCLAVSCGKAPVGNFTTPGFHVDTMFEFGQTASYTCETGYSLDGLASGSVTFTATCQEDGTFGGVETCEPVRCPVPMTGGAVSPTAFGANAAFNDVAALNFVYPQAMVVECLPGFEQRTTMEVVFSVYNGEGAAVWDGTPASALNGDWSQGATRNGKPTYSNSNGGVIQWEAGNDWGCVNMGQGGQPKWTSSVLGHHRYYNDADTPIPPAYGWVARAGVASGSMVISYHQASGTHATNYTVSCEATGTYTVPSDQCTAISCGDAPCVTNGDVSGSTFFGGSLTATAHDGYSLDGSTASDMKSFTYQCQAAGQFSSVRNFQKVSCGVAPDVDHSESVEIVEGDSTLPCTDCQWFDHPHKYSGGWAAGHSGSYDLPGAKAKCMELGDECKGVTCSTDGNCGCRASTTLGDSPSGETTWVPSEGCRSAPVVSNGGFESGSTTGTYEYRSSVPGFEVTNPANLHNRPAFIRSGNGAWGGTAAAGGNYFLGLQNAGTAITQNVFKHKVGAEYELTFKAAKRNHYSDPTLKVTVAGEEVYNEVPPSTSFTKFVFKYTAEAVSVEIKFENVSPEGDRTAFIDGINIREINNDPVCPPGSEMVGEFNADIPGCGLTSCDERYDAHTIEACKDRCASHEGCNSFNWAPLGGDRNHADSTVCTLYAESEPSGSWGPQMYFCRLKEPSGAAAVLLQEGVEDHVGVSHRPQSMIHGRGLNVRKVLSQNTAAKKSIHMALRKVNNTRHRVNNTLRRARTALAPVYGDTLSYTCAPGYHVRMREGDVLETDPKSFEYRCRSDGDLETTTPSGMLSPECKPITCPIPPSGPEASMFYNLVNGGDWTDVHCASGQKVVGGGCNANNGPWVMEYNGPNGVGTWTCGGHGGPKSVWAICSSRISPQIVESQGGDWHTVTCPAGKKVISGGCQANGSPHQAQYNGPDGDSAWKCGGHGGPKRVWALCSSAIQPHIVQVNTGDWGDAYCPSGMKVIGGGCNAHSHPYRLQYNGPDGENKWKCGGHGGGKTIWAMCVAINEAAEQFPNVNPHDSFKRHFGETVPMLCGEGYSLDGTPSGQAAFEESCLETGLLSHDNQCTDIDWCTISQCGDHGTCIDGVTGYTCQCEVGFRVTVTDGHLETCEQIDECETMSGNLLCGGSSSESGTCVDGTLRYNCSCAQGFESSPLGDGRDQCVRVTCDAPFELIHEGLDCQPSSDWLGLQDVESCAELTSSRGCSAFAHVTRGDENCKCCNDGYEANAGDPNIDIFSVGKAIPDRPHSSTPMAGRKLSYEGTAIYNCDSGYTRDGTAAGGTDYTVTCNADKQLSGFEDCRPVECGSLPSVTDATTDATSLVYGETARYTCAEHHTLNAQAGGPTTFDVGCTAAGTLTETYPCHLISCGVPTRPPYSGVSSDEKFVGDETTVECVEGYTLDASANGPSSFTLTCQPNGTFTGMQTCTKVSCGVPTKVENSQMSQSEFFYQDQFDITCHSGYSSDHTTRGASAFTATCEADGTFSGVGQCLPVSCGTPSAPSESTYDGGELFLNEVANFSCKEGFSTTGTTVGGEWYVKTCQSSGQLGRPNPGLCIDINYCTTNPCGANGVCTDSGVGVPFPGYSCSCLEGYEVTQRSDGGQTCSADDCAGNPCGSGGTCTDLSAQGGPQGAYQCNCESGYDLVEETPGQSTCRRAVCGPLPLNIQDVETDERTSMPVIAVEVYKGRLAYSTMTDAPILKSFDVATYRCDTGYSTDGLVGEQSRAFSVSCLGSGVFSRTLQPTLECQPVQCANYQNLRMPNSHIIRQRTVYVYGQSIEYECATGHTLNGQVGGPASYTVPCRADGTFPDSQTSCVATTCAVPDRPFAAADAQGTVQFGRVINYNCQAGYELGGNGSASFVGTCEADGSVSFSFGIGVCEPVSCGVMEPATNADILTYSTSSSSLSSVTMKSARGPDWFTLSCDAGQKAIGGGCDGNSHPYRYQVSNPESDGTTWRCGGSGAGKTIHVICSSLVTPEIVHANTGDWGTVTCPAGKKILSGGCDATAHPYIMQQNGPDGDNRWKCGGQGGPKRIYAVCSDIVEPTIVRAEGGDWVVAQCPSGMKVIGGGCNARSSPHVFSWNAPENDHAWKCGGHGSSKEAWAVCASAVPTYTPMPTGYEGTYGSPPARVVCRPGMTLGGVAGGATFYSKSCGADKAYSSTASGVCSTIKYAVGGLLTDAQSPSIRLSDATVTVRSVDGVNVIGTATSATSGIYWVDLPIGTWTFTVVKTGYITTSRNISISGYTPTGGAADMSLSQVLGEGEWRVVVEWDRHSRDIDSHTFWNNNAQHVYWARRSTLDHSSNIHVVLDRDDVSGFGPETTSFAGIGECEVTSQCLIKFEIDNYTPNDGCLGNSDVHVKLYRGSSMYAEYRIPECAGCPGRGHHWPVFTLDARVGHEAAHAGSKRLPPYLPAHEGHGQVDWSQTFDTQMWNMVPTGTLLTGFRAQALSNGGGRPEDAPVYTHISLFDADVVHNNLFGTGPDSGAEELRYHNVGHFGDRTFDLVVTGTSGNYARSATGTNGKSGDFGKINLRGCHAAEFDFTIVDAATGNPATIASFDITFFDLDDWNRHRKRELIRVSNYDTMTVAPDPVVAVTTERDGSVTARAQVNGLPNPSDPMTLTPEQMAGSVAFSFSMRSGFHTTLGSECDSGSSSGGRNLMFSFDSAMSPPDPGYQTALQYIHQIQYAETIAVGGLSGAYMDCEQVDFDLTAVGWAVCPEGKFLDGLYRVGSRYSEGDGPQQITRGSCCKAAEMPDEYGACTEETIFREANVMYPCPARTAIVGIHRGASHDTLDDIDKMRCCAFKDMDLLDDGPAQCTDA